MATLSEGPVWALLESPLREENPGCLAQRQIPGALSEASASSRLSAATLQRRCCGPSLPRSSYAAYMVLTAAVHAGALDDNLAALNIVTGQLAVIQLHLTGGQRGAVRVDKAAAFTGDASGVGDHHLRFTARHLDIAVELAGVATVHFIEDNTGLAPRQPWVSVNKTAELGLIDSVAVIEGHAAIIDIKLAVDVAGNPATAGRLNIDLRRAVGTADNGRLLAGGRTGIGHNIRLS